MRLFPGGPKFPAEFLDLIQSGRVVFFCGAGLSVGTGLPDFSGLVRELDEILNPDPARRFDSKRKDYDRMLDELKGKFSGGRERMCGHIREILSKSPSDPRGILSPDQVLENHRNILKLTAVPDGGFRLITTNFDDRFALAHGGAIQSKDWPDVSLPKDDQWESLVHLHGRLRDDGRSEDLILTASDFGDAYIRGRRAADFVIDLLRRWPVVFVGYGLNDPPMDYLVRAVYDARNSSEMFQSAFALVGCKTEEESERQQEWESKRVAPILYNDANNHQTLREILGTLARLKDEPGYRTELAIQGVDKNPDDEHGDNGRRVVWALRDSIAAKDFSKKKAFASVKDEDRFVRWLNSFKNAGLFQAVKAAPVDALDRPLCSLPPVAECLIDWAARHAHQPALLWWLADSHGSPHSQFLHRLYYFVNMGGRDERMSEELAEKWNLYIQEQLSSTHYGILPVDILDSQDISEWVRSNQEQLLLAALRPRPQVIPAVSSLWTEEWDRFKMDVVVDCEMDRMGQQAYYAREKVKESKFVMTHTEALSAHLEDAASLMKRCNIDSLSLRCFRPEEDDHYDTPHWLFLTLRVRDAVLGMIKEKDIPRLKKIVSRWMVSEHLLLRRLALFTITETAGFSEQTRLPIDWGAKTIIAHPDMLWALESGRESCRFLRKAGMGITPAVRAELEQIIRKGPLRSKYRTDLPDEDIDKMMRREIAKFLAKLELSGAQLSPESVRALADARKADPEKKFEEFMEYHSSKVVTSWQAADPGAPKWPGMPKQAVPEWTEMTAEECADHIQSAEHPSAYSLIKNHPDRAIEVFEILAEREIWKELEWSTFLSNFDWNQDIPDKITVRLIRLLETMPDKSAFALVRDYVRTLQIISRTRPFSELEKAWHRAWEFELDDRPTISGNHHISQLDIAINHAHGQLAEIPLTCLGRDEEREKLLDVLAKILAGEKPSHKYGKIVIGSHLFPLSRDFPEWTRQHLLPLFAPDHPMAFGIWEAFLYKPNISEKLLKALKPGLTHFLQRADDFHQRAGNLVGIFVVGGLLYPELIPQDEKRRIIAKMSPQGIRNLCWHMERELWDGNGAAVTKAWREQIFPFLRDAWPEKRRADGESSDISQALASLVILTGDAFPDAFKWAKDLLLRTAGQDHGMHPVTSFFYGHQEYAKNIPTKFPRDCLFFLDRIVPDEGFPSHLWGQLNAVLDKIKGVAPELEKRPEFIRLRKIANGG